MTNNLNFFRFSLCMLLMPLLANELMTEEEIKIKSIDATNISTLEDESLLMEGSVKIFTNQFNLETSKAIYNKKTGKLILEGDVKLLAEKVQSSSSSLFLDLNSNIMKLEDSNFDYLNQSFGNAKSIILRTAGETIITSSSWNNCSAEDPIWDLEIREVKLLEEKENVVIRGLTLKIKDIPIFYIPYVRSAVGDTRTSGFLAPSLKQGKDGLDISIPFYFNLAQNFDLEVSPRYISKRGLGFSSDFRYLTSLSSGQIKGALFNEDKEYLRETGDSNTNRWEASWKHKTDFSDNLSLNFNYQDTSDVYFYRDIGSDQYGSSKKNYLKKIFNLRWKNKNNKINLELKDYVKLNPFSSEVYKTLPRINSYSFYENDWIFSSLRTDVSKFKFDTSDQEIKRIFLNPKLGIRKTWNSSSLNFVSSSNYVRYKFDEYEFSNSSPSTEIDYKIFLSRPDTAKSSYLIPNVKYIYQDGEINPLTPLIDTRRRTLSYSSLFNKDLSSGHDRHTYSNRVVVGLKKIDMHLSKGLSNSFSIGRSFQLNKRDDENNVSNLITEYKSTMDNFIFSSSLETNRDVSNIDRAIISLVYSKEEQRRIEIRGIYDRNVQDVVNSSWTNSSMPLKQLELVMNWPLISSINFFGRFNRDLDSKKSLDLSYGVEYSNCCLKFGLMNRKWIEEDYFTWIENFDSPSQALQSGYFPAKERDSLLIFFEFKNLGRLGKDINQILSSPSLD